MMVVVVRCALFAFARIFCVLFIWMLLLAFCLSLSLALLRFVCLFAGFGVVSHKKFRLNRENQSQIAYGLKTKQMVRSVVECVSVCM